LVISKLLSETFATSSGTDMTDDLKFGALGPNAVHLCIDMQRLFAEDTEWHTPWIDRVLPQVESMVAVRPERTVFTRFVPPQSVAQTFGTWTRYYQRWRAFTLERLPPDLVNLVPALAAFVPPAMIFDKQVYSPWHDGALHKLLRDRATDTLIISGAETDVCVLGAVLGAVDRGYRVIITEDGICSSADDTHDALLALYKSRFAQQIEVTTTDIILGNWG
jgi:nicotinamidase-related amidase